MFNFSDIKKEDIREHNSNWSEWKTNALLGLINHESKIDKISFYTKDLHEAKYQLLINKIESNGWENLNVTKTFIEYSNYMDWL